MISGASFRSGLRMEGERIGEEGLGGGCDGGGVDEEDG